MYNYFSRNAQQANSDKLNNNLYCKIHCVKKEKLKNMIQTKNLIEWTACQCPIWLINASLVRGKYCDWCPILSSELDVFLR